ncbi:phage tail assembly protein [Burkholderia sp. Ac-20345]|uniref:phage tail assembly protein n=1 Tax=Burkholderia sp. Ac-20345 TaxID=2703891 RepID=UPI00197C731A|nr:phage tail assembly protein [Burkholderia sp. Ac-20345]MBN3779919.1 phage tail assembly protein [Burkholderia sp. Ac-20345]
MKVEDQAKGAAHPGEEGQTTTATRTPDGGVVVPLREPFKLADGREIDRITMRRAKVRDLKAAQRVGDDSVTQELALVGIISHEQVLAEDLENMDLGDYQRVQAAFRKMLDRPRVAAQGGGAAGTVVQVPAQ